MTRRVLLLIAVSCVLSFGCSSSSKKASTQPPPPPPARLDEMAPAPGSMAPAGSRGDYREIIKLNSAKLSETFIIEKVQKDGLVYDLNADEIIALRNAGVSERVIDALLMTTRPRESGAPPGAVGAATGVQAPAAPAIFEGLVRREGGVVLFKSRWHVGTLSVVEDTVRWVDAKDASRNLYVPMRSVNEHFLTCEKKPGGNECFEWGFKTVSGDEYVFRDVAWEQGVNDKVLEIHDLTKKRRPNLIDSMRPVDKK